LKVVNSYISNKEYNFSVYEQQLKIIISNINKILAEVLKDDNILPSFGGFTGKALQYEVKRELVEFLSKTDSVYCFKIEYFTSFIPISNTLDFSKSNSKKISNKSLVHTQLLDEKMVIDDSQNLNSVDNQYTVFDMKERPINDKEFIKKLVTTMGSKNVKKIVFENKNKIDNIQSSLVRIIAYNSNNYLIKLR